MSGNTVRDNTRRWAAVAVRTLSGAASVRITAAYAIVLVAVSLRLTALGPHAREVVVSRMSTNLHNLAHGHLSTLVGSAFVDEGTDIYRWLPGLVCLLALGELIWRSKGLVIAFAVGHIGATLIVAAGLVVAVEARWLPFSVAHASDVGTSYGAVCVLGALTASQRRRRRRERTSPPSDTFWRCCWASVCPSDCLRPIAGHPYEWFCFPSVPVSAISCCRGHRWWQRLVGWRGCSSGSSRAG